MKIKILLAAASALCLHTASFGQGSLTPPAGAPAPVFKTLDQLEPRTPISAAPYTITNPGSYFLTGNLTVSTGNAITIATNNVTLDLGGFTIASTAASATGNAIQINDSRANVTIFGGHIKSSVTNILDGVFGGGGFLSGIAYAGSVPSNVRVRSVSVTGVLWYGIFSGAGPGTVVEDCVVNVAGDTGIKANLVINSCAKNCGNFGINADTAQNCIGSAPGTGTGLSADTANNCTGINNGTGKGLNAYRVATGCVGFSLKGIGLSAYNASSCTGDRFGGTAIQATIATGCIAVNGTNLITYKYNMP